MDYIDFLEKKKVHFNESGFDIEDTLLNNNLFDFQRHIVKTA